MTVLASGSLLRLDASWVDYLLVAIYFLFVLGIGLMARRSVSTSLDFFLSGRSLPAWVTGLAFISANLGAVEIMGMSANGAAIGMPTFHYYWIGAIPAMLRQALAGEPVVAYRDWARSFCYARDAAEAVAILVEHGERGDWDVGRDDDLRTLEEVARLVLALTGADASNVEIADPPPGHTPLIEALDTDRLRSLGWRPAVDFEDGLRRTLESLREAA